MDNVLKAISLEEKERQVWQAWEGEFPRSNAMPVEISTHVVETFEDHVIVWFEDAHFSVSYTRDGDDIVFADRTQWEKVERDQQWLPAKNALKALSKTDDTLTVGNYIVLFGGSDLEGLGSDRVNPDGTRGERFTADTVLESSYTKAGFLHVDWEHSGGEIGGAILGVVDWKTVKVDEKGVFVERVLDRRSRYVQWVEGLIAQGLIGTSSEPVPEGVEKAADGTILKFPLRRDSLTVIPMEPRMMAEFGDNTLQAFKALGISVPEHTTEPEPAETEPEADPSAASVAGTRADIILFQVKLAGG